MNNSDFSQILMTIVDLLSNVIDELFRELMKYTDNVDNLPAVKKINEAAKLKADLIRENSSLNELFIRQEDIMESLTEIVCLYHSFAKDILDVLSQHQAIDAEIKRYGELERLQESLLQKGVL